MNDTINDNIMSAYMNEPVLLINLISPKAKLLIFAYTPRAPRTHYVSCILSHVPSTKMLSGQMCRAYVVYIYNLFDSSLIIV